MGRLDRLIQESAPQLERCILSGLLAYGPVHYRYASGREGDAARLAIASNASAISFYVFAADEDGWLAPRYETKLPKAKIGKCCVRFKRLDELDLHSLEALVREAAASSFSGEVTETSKDSAAAGKSGASKRASKPRADRSRRR